MCGFLAIFSEGQSLEKEWLVENLSELNQIKKRGPNDSHWVTMDRAVLFHSRLVTLTNLSEDKQPLLNGDQLLLFNGDFYNYQEFGTKGDSSTFFELLQVKGEEALSLVNGNFSLVFGSKDSLLLARDRIGIRSLFYTSFYWQKQWHLGVSTNLLALAQLRKKCDGPLTLRHEFFDQYRVLRYGANLRKSVFEEIDQLAPGTTLTFDRSFKGKRPQGVEKTYWSLEEKALSFSDGDSLDEEKQIEELIYLLKDSVELRSLSHGHEFSTFLSGGVDSGLINAIAHKRSGFKEALYLSMPKSTNEDQRLERFLKSYPLALKRLNFGDFKARDTVSLMGTLEQPFGDSIISLVDILCSQTQTNIVLSGEGADEVFGGYVHHRVFFYARLLFKSFPGLSQRAIIPILEKLPLSFWNTFFPYNQGVDSKGLQKFISFLKSFKSPAKAYLELVGLGSQEESERALEELGPSWPKWESFSLSELLRFDLKFWSPQYSLYKMDRIGFSHGVDIRVPFFDHRLVEWSLKNHEHFGCINLRQNKLLLRKAISRGGLLKSNLHEEKKFPFRLSEKDQESKLSLIEGKQKTLKDHESAWYQYMKEQGISYDNTSKG